MTPFSGEGRMGARKTGELFVLSGKYRQASSCWFHWQRAARMLAVGQPCERGIGRIIFEDGQSSDPFNRFFRYSWAKRRVIFS